MPIPDGPVFDGAAACSHATNPSVARFAFSMSEARLPGAPLAFAAS
jgi:hypothetical protein